MLQISTHPLVWAQSNVYCRWALFRETTVLSVYLPYCRYLSQRKCCAYYERIMNVPLYTREYCPIPLVHVHKSTTPRGNNWQLQYLPLPISGSRLNARNTPGPHPYCNHPNKIRGSTKPHKLMWGLWEIMTISLCVLCCCARFCIQASLGVQDVSECGTFIDSVLHSLFIATWNKQMHQLLYCPGKVPMGSHSSSAKNWGWVLACMNGSTISPPQMRS